MELLDCLASILDCQYLSDLHTSTITDKQAEEIKELPESVYTVSDFKKAAEYILDCEMSFTTAKEAKEAIIEKLSQQPERSKSDKK